MTELDVSAIEATTATDPLLVPRVHRVEAVFEESPGVVTLRVVPVDGDVPSFLPGQVSMVGAFGIGEAAISISSAVAQTEFHDYTIRRAGAITSALTRMRPGDELWARGPFGTAWDLDLDGCDVVVAAGGIGIAPLRAALFQLMRYRERYGEIILVAGAREAARVLYHDQFDGWREHGLTVVATIDHPEEGWHECVGYASDIVAATLDEHCPDPERVRALVCGPDIMMCLSANEMIAAGVDAAHIQLTIERNMQCGNGLCGHCQMGGVIVCRDGPVVRYPDVAESLAIAEW